MKRAAVFVLIGMVLGAVAGPLPVMAQGDDDSCPALVDAALAMTAESCEGTGRNRACYGHRRIEWQPGPDAADVNFEQAGDIVDLSRLASLHTSALDVETATWGIALLRLQADLPDSLPGQNVTMLLFGDVALADTSETSPLPYPVPVMTMAGVNIRALPLITAPVLGSLAVDERAIIDGRSEDARWLRVRLPGDGVGWVAAQYLSGDFAPTDLPVVDNESEAVGPMQAFTFTTGFGEPLCEQAPADGLLIQTPAGRQVSLRVNGVRLTLGSTAYLQAEASDEMVISVVEGQATLTAFAVTRTVPEGAFATVPLDEDGQASGPPTAPEPYDESTLAALPLGILERVVTVAPAWNDILTPTPSPAVTPGPADPLAGVGPGDACTVAAGGSSINLRSGPGTNYPVQGQLTARQTATPDGRAEGADTMTWWRLPAGSWVRADVVGQAGDCAAVPLVTESLPPTPVPAAPAPTGGSMTVSIEYPSGCNQTSAPAGTFLRVSYGQGYSTEAEANAGLSQDNPAILINGVVASPATYRVQLIPENPDDSRYSLEVFYDWGTPPPGTYTLTANDRGNPRSCVFTVTE